MSTSANVLLNREQAAGFLSVKPQTLAVWASTGRGPTYVKVGRSVRYRQSDLDSWIESRRVVPAETALAGR